MVGNDHAGNLLRKINDQNLVEYLNGFQRQSLLDALIHTVDWHQDYYVAYGRRFYIPRLQAWFADNDVNYGYSNNLLRTQVWLDPLNKLKRLIESATDCDFNSVLLTYYRTESDHVAWHSDDDLELGDRPYIASLSLGAERIFEFCRKHDSKNGSIHSSPQVSSDVPLNSLPLRNGDLLFMLPRFQSDWVHRVPVATSECGPRINLTFRKVCNSPDR